MDRLLRKIRPLLLSWLRRSRSRKLPLLQHFSYKDIKRATDGFNRVIYTNSHGAAYKARFRDGKVALVKEVKRCEEDQDVFYREVQLLGRLHHRHLLALKGYSIGSKRLLVFDNIDNGTLKEHLNDPLRTPLDWNARLRIAFGVAAALEYLLLFSNPPIYQVSVSSSNIMLDDNFIAKLSEVSIIKDAQNYVNIPNGSSSEGYTQNSRNIVFQLGVLILELVTGQASEKGNTDIIEWIQESRLGNSIHRMIDPDLGNDYNSKELRNLLAIARLCIDSKDEPKFSVPQIFRYLQKKVDISRS